MYIKGYDAIQEHSAVHYVIMRPLTALDKDRIRELVQQGMSTRQIAAMTLQSHMTVSRVSHKLPSQLQAVHRSSLILTNAV